MLTKSELKEVFTQYDFRPLKRLGENYLIDGNIKDKIIKEARISEGCTVLEIGPGLGALTIDLAGTGAKIFAVEKDKKAFAILKDLAGENFPDLKLFNEDILKFDLKNIAGRKKIKVIGNLPYYITTPILEYLIENRPFIDSALIVIQKEVAVRLLASPGTKDYGSISCFLSYYTKPSYIYTIKRTCFYPSPEVDSGLIRLEMLTRPSVEVKDEKLLFKIIRGAFNQRRKSVINSLSRPAALDMPKEDLSLMLKKAGIDPAVRPENLSLADFAKISEAIPPITAHGKSYGSI